MVSIFGKILSPQTNSLLLLHIEWHIDNETFDYAEDFYCTTENNNATSSLIAYLWIKELMQVYVYVTIFELIDSIYLISIF